MKTEKKLTKTFIEKEIRTRKWGSKLEKFIAVNARLRGEQYVLSKESWDNFLVDVGLKKSRGLGDTVAKITKAVGIKPCGACNKRRQKLNNFIKF